MGWNFGGAVIDFDFRKVIGELGEDLARPRHGGESAEELEEKDRIDAGAMALAESGWRANAADARLSFGEASSRDFFDFACARVNGKTLLLSSAIGTSQEGPADPVLCALSSRRGDVLLFWINDASGTYAFSLFHKGQRVRLFTTGDGLSDDEGALLPGEAGERHGYDRTMAVFMSFLGATVMDLFDMTFERFDAA